MTLLERRLARLDELFVAMPPAGRATLVDFLRVFAPAIQNSGLPQLFNDEVMAALLDLLIAAAPSLISSPEKLARKLSAAMISAPHLANFLLPSMSPKETDVAVMSVPGGLQP